jgi:predicted hydrocarbon binding protein
MSEKWKLNTPEDLEIIKNSITLDDDGMLTSLGKRFIITPQETFSNMMYAAVDIGGINLAKVFMRRAGYEAAYKVAESMIEKLGLNGEELVRHYTKTGGKRGWSFGEAEKFDPAKGVFVCRALHSPFVIRFAGNSKVPVCDFLAGAFEAMCHAGGFKEMRIVETQCVAKGDSSCVFESKASRDA